MSAKRPNIILIIPDQQRFDTIAAAGYEYMITPNLDRLAGEGVIMDQCFTQGACCMPARAAFFAGKYAHQLDILTNVERWDGQDNWVKQLSTAGYQTASIGKMHTKPWRSPCGFEYRFVCENKNEPFPPGVEPDEWVKYLASKGLERPLDYPQTMDDFFDRMGDVDFPLDTEHHEDMFIARKTVEWIEQRQDDRPLFLHVGFAGPHDPYDAPKQYKDMYRDRDIPSPHAVPGERQNKPPEQNAAMAAYETEATESTIRLSHATPDRLRRLRSAYYAGITLIDEQIGKIIETLDARGLLEDSVIIFCSDHGCAMGDNEMVHKWFMYDSMTRVPMLLWGPKYFPNGRFNALVELFDVAPTILELAGAEVPDDLEARSFLPLLKGDQSSTPSAPSSPSSPFAPRECVFCEEKHIVMARTSDWKLVYYNGKDYGELYDLAADPHESTNLWDSPDHQQQKDKLIATMEDWYARTGGRCETLEDYT